MVVIRRTDAQLLHASLGSVAPSHRHHRPPLPPALAALEPALEVQDRRVRRHAGRREHGGGQLLAVPAAALDEDAVARAVPASNRQPPMTSR